MIMNTIIMFFIVQKGLYYISVFEKFSQFFILIKKVVIDIIPFFAFFVIMLLANSMLYTISGVDIIP
jgi:hypothetical protein